ncbi:MAG: hypothetical protein COA67_05665 [Lutibacter sp.]|nr:MAG: hypothetical protein COA67_05665 [Lutibacter sp.]
MKTIKLLLLFTLIIASISNINAQNEKRTYFFTMSTAFIDGEGKKAIITTVQSTTCYYGTTTLDNSITNQVFDYLKSEYKNWHKYDSKIAFTFASKSEAEKRRIKYIGEYKDDNYTVTKDIHFKYYCDN